VAETAAVCLNGPVLAIELTDFSMRETSAGPPAQRLRCKSYFTSGWPEQPVLPLVTFDAQLAPPPQFTSARWVNAPMTVLCRSVRLRRRAGRQRAHHQRVARGAGVWLGFDQMSACASSSASSDERARIETETGQPFTED
jgi:hypothetical protein